MALKVTENRGSGLDYLVIEPDDHSADKDYPLIFLLHGFGADMRDLAGLCENIHLRGYVYICPNAPLQFQIGPGRMGYGWTPPRDEVTQEDFQRATELLEGFFWEVQERYQVTSGRSLLLGFSQGGAMTYRCGLTNPDSFAGLAILSSALRYPEQLKAKLPSQRGQPIFIAHGLLDTIAPVEGAREAKVFLESEGYRPRYQEYQMGHEISQQVMGDLVPWINNVLPPVVSEGE